LRRSCKRLLCFNASEQNLKSREQYKKDAVENWYFWKPIVCGALTYTEAINLEDSVLLEACAAIDYREELIAQSMKKK